MKDNNRTIPNNPSSEIHAESSARRQFWQGCKIGLILVLLLVGICCVLLCLPIPFFSSSLYTIILFTTMISSIFTITILYTLIWKNFYRAIGIFSIILLPILFFGICTHQVKNKRIITPPFTENRDTNHLLHPIPPYSMPDHGTIDRVGSTAEQHGV